MEKNNLSQEEEKYLNKYFKVRKRHSVKSEVSGCSLWKIWKWNKLSGDSYGMEGCSKVGFCGSSGRQQQTKITSIWFWYCVVLVLLAMSKVSEECPTSCECKWKSGKESVVCSNAKLNKIPYGLDPGTQLLDLSNNKLQALPANVFLLLNLLNLQKIFLSYCLIVSIDRYTFAKLINLVELDLTGNKLDHVPSHTFEDIPELRELKLNFNPISRISSDAFIHLPRLVRLEMTSCKIGTIETFAFRGLSSLEWLRLDNNRLLSVQATSFLPLKSLHGIQLHSNPWNCSCSLQPLRDWMLKSNVPFEVPPKCSSPKRLEGKPWNRLELEDFACLPKLQSSPTQNEMIRRVVEGENVTLLCRLEVTPDTQVQWLNGNKGIVTNSTSFGASTSGTMSMSISGAGTKSITHSSVFVITESFVWRESEFGHQAHTQTTVTASPAIDKGSQRRQSLSSGDRNLGVKMSQLTIIGITARDADVYICCAQTRAGSVSTNFTIIVGQQKADNFAGRILFSVAVVAALLMIALCVLLFFVVFNGNTPRSILLCSSSSSSRVATEDKYEMNHVSTRQNGGASVIPLISNSNHTNASPAHNYNHNHVGAGHSNSNSLSGNRRNNGASNRDYKSIPTVEIDSDEEQETKLVHNATDRIVDNNDEGENIFALVGQANQKENKKEDTLPNVEIVSQSVIPDPKSQLHCQYQQLERNKKPDTTYTDFASLPRHTKTHHYEMRISGGNGPTSYFTQNHRRINSESQSPLLPSSYGNSAEKISLGSGNNFWEAGHSNLYYDNYKQPSYNGASGSSYLQNYYSPYPRQRLSMPTSPVHEERLSTSWTTNKQYPSESGTMYHYRHHSGSGSEIQTMSNKSYGGSDNGSSMAQTGMTYDYHAAQLAAFLEEYRQLQMELMEMSANLRKADDHVHKPIKSITSTPPSTPCTKTDSNRPCTSGTMMTSRSFGGSTTTGNLSLKSPSKSLTLSTTAQQQQPVLIQFSTPNSPTRVTTTKTQSEYLQSPTTTTNSNEQQPKSILKNSSNNYMV